MIEQLQKNKRALTRGLLNKVRAPETQLSIASKQALTSSLDKGFNKDKIGKHLSNMVCSTITDHEIGERLEALGRQKGVLMKSKEKKAQNTESINDLNIENE